jgi:hypothetical protein
MYNGTVSTKLPLGITWSHARYGVNYAHGNITFQSNFMSKDSLIGNGSKVVSAILSNESAPELFFSENKEDLYNDGYLICQKPWRYAICTTVDSIYGTSDIQGRDMSSFDCIQHCKNQGDEVLKSCNRHSFSNAALKLFKLMIGKKRTVLKRSPTQLFFSLAHMKPTNVASV